MAQGRSVYSQIIFLRLLAISLAKPWQDCFLIYKREIIVLLHEALTVKYLVFGKSHIKLSVVTLL